MLTLAHATMTVKTIINDNLAFTSTYLLLCYALLSPEATSRFHIDQ